MTKTLVVSGTVLGILSAGPLAWGLGCFLAAVLIGLAVYRVAA